MAYVSMTDLFPPDLSGKRYYGPGSTGVAPPAGLNIAAEAAKAAASGSAPPVQQVTWQPATSVAAAMDPRTLQTQNTYIAQQMEKHWTPEQAAAQPVYQQYQQQQMDAEIQRLKNQQSAQEQYEQTRRLVEAQARAAEQQRLQAEAQRRAQEEAAARARADQEAAARAQAESEAAYLRQVGAMQAQQIAQQQAALQQQAIAQQQAAAYQAAQQQAAYQQPSYQQPSYESSPPPAPVDVVQEEAPAEDNTVLIVAGVALVGALGFWLYTRRSKSTYGAYPRDPRVAA